MSRYIPMPAYYDRMPVDISFVFEDEKPAGKHGFLTVDGEDFRFEDGTLAKFWGVNINGGANFPEHDYAERFARRLAQTGCNLVRLHQLDAEWDTPNIFAFTKGKRVTTTRKLDPVSLERLDYLIYSLKQEGIYVYLDVLNYRKYKEGDDVVDHDQLSDVAKPYNMTNRRLIDLQKEYMTNLWTHYNPYTKLAYKDDPVIVMSEMIAECDLFNRDVEGTWWYTLPEYYDKEYRQMFKAWLDKNGLEYDWENCDMFTNDETLIAFKSEVTENFLAEMYSHMRAIGVKCPIAGTNWSAPTHALTKAHKPVDYMDIHPYYNIDGWSAKWSANERIVKHKSITSTKAMLGWHTKTAVAGKPLFVSEWDMTWPNNYRAESPIYYAAIGALQGWGGACIHTYAYTSQLQYMNILGKELSSPVAGKTYREGIYTVWNDPAKFGLFYHSALITRRGDVSPATKRIAVKPSDPTLVKAPVTPFMDALEQHRVRMHFGDELPEGYDELVLDNEHIPHPDPKVIMSDHGQMWRDPAKEIGAVDTERTKCFYGMLGKGFTDGSIKPYKRPVHKMDGLEIECATDFGVIALSSLTNEPIETSDNILLSAIGRARNTDMVFDGDKLLDFGKPPIMAEVIDSIVRVKNVHGTTMKVWGVNAEGFYSGMLPTTYEDGWLSFRIGDENNPACYYLIVKE